MYFPVRLLAAASNGATQVKCSSSRGSSQLPDLSWGVCDSRRANPVRAYGLGDDATFN